MTPLPSKSTRGKTLSLVVGFFALLVVACFLVWLLDSWARSKRQFDNQSYAQILAAVPRHFRTNSEAPILATLTKNDSELIPRFSQTLLGPSPLRYRVTRRLPKEIREALMSWLPRSRAQTLFLSPKDVLRSREQALWALTLIESDQTTTIIDTLRAALDRPEPTIQRQAIATLGRFGIGATGAVPKLIPFLKSFDPHLRYQAVKTLGAIGEGSTPAIGAIETLIEDPSEMVRAAAVVTYGRVVRTKKRLSPLLERALLDQSSQVRYAAAQAMGRTASEDPSSVPPLVRALQDTESQVRRSAAIAIGQIGPTAADAVPALAHALWDERMEVRISSAEALGKIGPLAKSAIPDLIDALNNDFAGMGIPAHEAIKKIDPASDRGIAPR